MPEEKNLVWKQYKEEILKRIGDFSVIFSSLEKQEEHADGWVTALCCFHNDHTPSFAFNRKTGRWACFAGCGKGSAIDFVMLTSGKPFKETLIELGDKFGVIRPTKEEKRPPISEELVKKWTENLWQNEEIVRWLREKRGLSDAILKKCQIGWDPKRQRNTIPIRDSRGNLVNVRFYNAKKDPKIINYVEGVNHYGSPPRLYGVNKLIKSEKSQVLLCEGEFDRLILCQEDFLAVTGTHGCATFLPEWIEAFKEKDVVITFDCDTEGQAAVNKIILKAFKEAVISGKVRSIKNILLPLRGDKDDKDITDYFHKRGFTATDLQKLIDETPKYSYITEEKVLEAIRLDSFIDIEKKEFVDAKVQTEIMVCGETSEAFHAVEEFKITFCPRLKKGECYDCVEPIKVPHGSQEYIGSCMSTNVQLIASLRAFCCKYGQKPTIEITKRTTVKEFFCHQRVHRISITADEQGKVTELLNGVKQELVEKRVYYLSSENVLPINYLATGWVKTHPKTQQITFLIESLVPQEDDFESFRIEEHLAELKEFQKLSWMEILEDLSENLTRIFERDEILTAVLLSYFSPLQFRFNNELMRGWILTAIIGDSGTGKTQTAARIAEFADVGDFFSGLTGTRTGLAYALVEHKQKGWQVKIGIYPRNDRKILMVDETQHLPDSDLRAISKAMDEGFLQIDRVKSKGYHSRTRLILICNPKKDKIMDEHTFGCQTMIDLFPPTIIRRLDFAVFANSSALDSLSRINEKAPRDRKGKISPEMLRSAIFWTWNLKPEQIIFTPEAEEECLKESEELGNTFGNTIDVPLVPKSDIRKKLARISAAFAAMLLSSNENFTQLIVKDEHVKKAVFFLNSIYLHNSCSLNTYSNIVRAGTELLDYEEIKQSFLYRKNITYTDSAKTFCRIIHLLYITENIPREDLAEQAGCSIPNVKNIIGILKQFNLLESTRLGYRKKPKFVKFLRRFLEDDDTKDFFNEAEESSLKNKNTTDISQK